MKKIYEKSYFTYLKKRREFEEQGFAMDRPLSMEEYKDYYIKAKDANMKNIARTFARADKSWGQTKRKAIAVQENLKTFDLKTEGLTGKDKQRIVKTLIDSFGMTKTMVESEVLLY